jgi:hypothetical protein
MTTLLDAHSEIAMGAELVPPVIEDGGKLADAIEEGIRMLGEDEARGIAKGLDEFVGGAGCGVFFKRAVRTGVGPARVAAIVRAIGAARTVGARMELARRIAEAARGDAKFYGFKGGVPDGGAFTAMDPGARWVVMHRDPRDVAVSSIGGGFVEGVEASVRSWMRVARTWGDGGERAMHVRYEDLVGDPEGVMARVFRWVGVEPDPGVIGAMGERARLTSGVLRHTNHERLIGGIDTGSVGRWARELGEADRVLIERRCGAMMRAMGYEVRADARPGIGARWMGKLGGGGER